MLATLRGAPTGQELLMSLSLGGNNVLLRYYLFEIV